MSISSELAQKSQSFLKLLYSFLLQLRSHHGTFRLCGFQLIGVVTIKLYLFLNLLLFSYCDSWSLWISNHLINYNLVFFDAFFYLVQNDDCSFFYIFVFRPINHVVFVFAEGRVKHLRCVIYDSLLYSKILLVYII